MSQTLVGLKAALQISDNAENNIAIAILNIIHRPCHLFQTFRLQVVLTQLELIDNLSPLSPDRRCFVLNKIQVDVDTQNCDSYISIPLY
jgi:hypothetical protein